MALQALWSPEQQFQNTNGSILTNGKIYIQYRGRTALAEVFGDASGEHRRANPVILDANGRALCFADDSFSYTAVVCDFYGKELFSFDPIPCGAGSGSSQITGAPSAHWLGRFGDTRVVSAGQYSDSLPLPANPDYDGSFIESIQGNSNITLATGLYIIDAIVRFRQNPDDLQNLFGQVQVFTGWRDDETTWELRNETGPDSSQEDMHQFRVHLVRHVTGNGDKNFCIQVKTPVNWSWCQIQSLSILSLSSSSGGYGQYIPGDYIQIESDGTINVVGLQPSGNYADASSVSQGFYAVNQQLSALSGQINEVSGQIPSLDGYATQNWVNDQGFLKEVPSQYVTESELNSAVSGKADKSEIPSLDGYATETYVQGQVSGLASESYVQSAVSGKQDALTFTYDDENKITTIDGHGIAGTGGGGSGAVYTPGQYISIQNDIISVTGLQPSGDYQPAGDYLTQDDLNGYVKQEELSSYATDDDVEEATSGKLDSSAYVAPMNADWSATSGLGEILNKPATEEVQFEELDLSSYVQQSELSGYASKNDLSGKLDTSAYVAPQNADWNSTSGLSQILNKPSTEEVQFEELNLSAYATLDDVDEATSGKADLSAIANLSAGVGISITASGDGYVISSEGGGSVPEGVMAESGLNYTQNGEISGYNNSAFYDAPLNDFVNQNSGAWGGSALNVSAGPGIKLDMVDDTLVASLDETVLFDTSSYNGAGTINLSEPYTNFERLKVLAVRGNADQSSPYAYSGPWWEYETDGIVSSKYVAFGSLTPAIFERQFWKYSVYSATNTSTFVWCEGGQKNILTTGAGTTADTYTASVGIKKVIGINRK